VFLNLVEYYQGILFVTTNRESAFDDAFKNRMHAILKFLILGVEARHNIRRNLLVDRPNPVPLDGSWSQDKDELKVLAKLDLNGRDIRNLIRSAWAFASSDKKPLGVRHIVAVLLEITKEERWAEVNEITEQLRPVLQRVPPLTDDGSNPALNTLGVSSEVAEEDEDTVNDPPYTWPLIGGLQIRW
jgi:SpoVK/Ycf46/Vps4 family AAA+-type ATPase